MSYVLFALACAIIWAIGNTVDKFYLDKWLDDPKIPMFILAVVGVVISAVIFLVRPVAFELSIGVWLSLLSGVANLAILFCYFYALKLGEVSRVIPILSTTPIFTAILAFFFLGEIFNAYKYAGIILIVAGAILIEFRKGKGIKLNKAFLLAVLGSAFGGIWAILTKMALNRIDFWSMFAYARIGVFIAMLPWMPGMIKGLIKATKKFGLKVPVLISGNEIWGYLGTMANNFAYTIGPASLVSALANVQPVFTLILTVFLTLVFPKFLKEQISKEVIIMKVISTIMIVAGVFLVSGVF